MAARMTHIDFPKLAPRESGRPAAAASRAPLVSAVIPTYNRKEFIPATVESVLAQTYRHIECIVVDDGSTDGTGAMLQTRFGNDSRFRYIHQQNQERSVARNTGIRQARGELIAFLDSDDVWLPMKIEKQVQYFVENPQAGFVYCWCTNWDGVTPATLGYLPEPPDSTSRNRFRELCRGNFINSPVPVVRRQCFETAGLFSERQAILCFEDWEMWTRLSYHTEFGLVPEVLAWHRVHPGNTELPVTPRVRLEHFRHVRSYADSGLVREIGVELGSLVLDNARRDYEESLFREAAAGFRVAAILQKRRLFSARCWALWIRSVLGIPPRVAVGTRLRGRLKRA